VDGDCGNGQICWLGGCAPLRGEDEKCMEDADCAEGRCLVTCFTPGSKGPGEHCNVLADAAGTSQCQGGLVCIPGVFVSGALVWTEMACSPKVEPGAECSADAQCPEGMVCRPILLNGSHPTYCLFPYGSQPLDGDCSDNLECGTAFCLAGICACVPYQPWTCNLPGEEGLPERYCGWDFHCHTKQPEGGDCCLDADCAMDACTTDFCYVNVAGARLGQGTCFVPWSVPAGGSCVRFNQCQSGICLEGTCRCVTLSGCSDSEWCDLTGTCRHRSGPGEFCLLTIDVDLGECQAGLVCDGPYVAGGKCYPPDGAYGSPCAGSDHCSSGHCDPRGQFQVDGECSPARVMEAVSQGQDPGCGFEGFYCACAEDGDCPGEYCGALSVMGVEFTEMQRCRPRLGYRSVCDRDVQCSSLRCIPGNVGGVSNCGCGGNEDCGWGRKCDNGTCKYL
jgi:hypothetical protein